MTPLSWLSRQPQPAGQGQTDWVVLIEYTPDLGAEGVTFEAVQQLVARLRTRVAASALYCPDRYALQLTVEAGSASSAITAALALHDAAARREITPGWSLAMAEVHTAEKFERAMHEDLRVTGERSGVDLDGASEAIAAHHAFQRIHLVATIVDAASVLADFVSAVGAHIEVARERRDDESPGVDSIPYDLSLGCSSPVMAIAQPGTTARLVLDCWLPTLIAQAERQLHIGPGGVGTPRRAGLA